MPAWRIASAMALPCFFVGSLGDEISRYPACSRFSRHKLCVVLLSFFFPDRPLESCHSSTFLFLYFFHSSTETHGSSSYLGMFAHAIVENEGFVSSKFPVASTKIWKTGWQGFILNSHPEVALASQRITPISTSLPILWGTRITGFIAHLAAVGSWDNFTTLSSTAGALAPQIPSNKTLIIPELLTNQKNIAVL